MFYRHVFDRIFNEFRGITLFFCEFRGIPRIYLNFAAPRPLEISEALVATCSRVRTSHFAYCVDLTSDTMFCLPNGASNEAKLLIITLDLLYPQNCSKCNTIKSGHQEEKGFVMQALRSKFGGSRTPRVPSTPPPPPSFWGLSAGTREYCICIVLHLLWLGLVGVWSCFVFCLLLLSFYVICTPVVTEGTAFLGLRLSLSLRTVPTIVTAHTFCASRDTRFSYRWCLLIQEYFCAEKVYGESRTYQMLLVSQKKFGGNHAFFRDN